MHDRRGAVWLIGQPPGVGVDQRVRRIAAVDEPQGRVELAGIDTRQVVWQGMVVGPLAAYQAVHLVVHRRVHVREQQQELAVELGADLAVGLAAGRNGGVESRRAHDQRADQAHVLLQRHIAAAVVEVGARLSGHEGNRPLARKALRWYPPALPG